MYELIKTLYLSDRISSDGLVRAVIKGWITESQKETILTSKQEG